jgi:hypothetical protein
MIETNRPDNAGKAAVEERDNLAACHAAAPAAPAM